MKNRGIFLTDSEPLVAFQNKHVVEYYLELLKFLDISPDEEPMQIASDPPELEWAREYLKGKNIEGNPLVAIIPGGGASWGREAYRKRLPVETFVKIANRLAEDNVKIAVLGDSLEDSICLYSGRQSA